MRVDECVFWKGKRVMYVLKQLGEHGMYNVNRAFD